MPIIGSQGNTIAVFKFRLYDIVRDEFIISRRYATMQAIERLRAERAGPSIEVAQDAVDGDGFTVIDYAPG